MRHYDAAQNRREQPKSRYFLTEQGKKLDSEIVGS